MRTIVVAVMVVLGISCALPETQAVASVPPVQTVTPPPAAAAKPTSVPIPTPAEAASVPPQSLDNVCSTLLTSAQDNDLPVPFFANLIWQESRLRDKALSPKGAMGIAQFMPKVAAKSGVQNPFDPSQALPASAKMLRGLFDQFGNLGYTAAAYNAGATRVLDWVEHGRVLPRETRDYVKDITGRSIEAWRKNPGDDAGLRFSPQLPCRSLPAFAEVAQAQAQQATPQQATPSQHVTPVQQKTPVQTAAARRPQTVAKMKAVAAREKRVRVAEAGHRHTAIRHQAVRTAERKRPRTIREAKAHIHHAPRERYRRA